MSGFTKLVPEIVQSSLWNEPAEIRCVWIAMIATKDENGYVRGDARTIARVANVSLESTESALAMFQEPDPSSHTPDNDGKRIMPAPGGWIVLNHSIYRARDDVYRAKNRERVKRFRDKMEQPKENVTLQETLQKRNLSASASASASESVKEGSQEGGDLWSLDDVLNHASHPSCGVTKDMATECFDHYAAAGWVNASGNPVGRTVNQLKSLLRKWRTNQASHGKRGELPDAPTIHKPKPKQGDLIADCARDLWDKRNDDSGFKRVLSVWRDKTRDMIGVVDEAMDIIKYRRERGEK